MKRRSTLDIDGEDFFHLMIVTIVPQIIVSVIAAFTEPIVLMCLKDNATMILGLQGDERAILISLIVLIIAELIVLVVYCRKLLDIFGEVIDVFFNLYANVLSLATGLFSALFLYPRLFPVSFDELPSGFSAETIRLFIYFISPILVAILSLVPQYVYIFKFYARSPLDWLFVLLFVLGSVGVFTLLMYVMHWLVIVAGSVIGLIGVLGAILAAPTTYLIIIRKD